MTTSLLVVDGLGYMLQGGFGLGNVRRPLVQLKEKAKQEMLDTLKNSRNKLEYIE